MAGESEGLRSTRSGEEQGMRRCWPSVSRPSIRVRNGCWSYAVLCRHSQSFGGYLTSRTRGAAYDAVGGKHQLCYIHVNRNLATVEVRRGVEDRGFLEPTPVRFRMRGRPTNALKEFLRFANLFAQLEMSRFVQD